MKSIAMAVVLVALFSTVDGCNNNDDDEPAPTPAPGPGYCTMMHNPRTGCELVSDTCATGYEARIGNCGCPQSCCCVCKIVQ